jgi:hypothetical protein
MATTEEGHGWRSNGEYERRRRARKAPQAPPPSLRSEAERALPDRRLQHSTTGMKDTWHVLPKTALHAEAFAIHLRREPLRWKHLPRTSLQRLKRTARCVLRRRDAKRRRGRVVRMRKDSGPAMAPATTTAPGAISRCAPASQIERTSVCASCHSPQAANSLNYVGWSALRQGELATRQPGIRDLPALRHILNSRQTCLA